LGGLRGHWVLLFSHPADFTPVCSTEFAELARRQADFEALDCKLLGLSVDSLYAHLAWAKALKELFGVHISFPILEDPSMSIARAYGMLKENAFDSATVRSTFFIDPHGIVRAITCYPYDVGRSVEEMLRLLRALRKVSSAAVMAPEGWDEGKPLLSLPLEQPGDASDWFCQYEGES